MHRSALPNVVRTTLNDMAFVTKSEKLLKVTNQKFTIRSKNFFKANSGVNKATGYDVGKMVAEAGIHNSKMNSNSNAVKHLEQQETGGVVKERGFVAIKGARIGKSADKKVGKNNSLDKINNIVVSGRGKSRNKSKKQKYIRAAIVAGAGGYMLHNKTMFRIKSIKKRGKSKKIFIKSEALYHYNKSKTATVNRTAFMERSALLSVKHKDDFFYKAANFQIEKLKKKNKL